MKRKPQSSIERVLSSINIQTQKRTRLGLLDWIADRKIMLRTSTRIIPFSLDRHEYLREIYEHHPHEVYEKAAQVCISVYHVLKALWLCDQYTLKALYYFPTDDDVRDFGDDRLDPIIKKTEYLRERVVEAKEEGGVYNKGLKHVGESSIYMRGMFTRAAVKSIDGDYLVLDELDECDQTNREFAFDRIMHSELQWASELSQPSLPDFGIDQSFAESDQRYWLLKCPACGHYNCLEEDFPQNFMRVSRAETVQTGQKYYRGCLKCNAPLDMAAGEWVPRQDGRDKRGYHLAQLYTQIKPAHAADPADQIMAEFHRARKSPQKERFMISRVGNPYGGERQPVTETVLNACEARYAMGPLAGIPTGIGIDVGDTKHLVVRGKSPETGRPRILWAESFEDWERAATIIKLFGESPFIIDALPYKDSAKKLVQAFPGKGRIQYFKETEKETTEGEYEKEIDVLHVDRTESLDNTTGEFADRLIEIPSLKFHEGEQLKALEELRAHLKHLVADMVEDTKGIKRRVYKANVANHYGMAANSARLAEEYGE